MVVHLKPGWPFFYIEDDPQRLHEVLELAKHVKDLAAAAWRQHRKLPEAEAAAVPSARNAASGWAICSRGAGIASRQKLDGLMRCRCAVTFKALVPGATLDFGSGIAFGLFFRACV